MLKVKFKELSNQNVTCLILKENERW